MSMARDEIMKAYEGAVFDSGLAIAAGNEEAAKDYELLKAGLDALRFPTREMVERMRGGSGGSVLRTGGNRSRETSVLNADFSITEHQSITIISALPAAVDIMLERWKEVLENDN